MTKFAFKKTYNLSVISKYLYKQAIQIKQANSAGNSNSETLRNIMSLKMQILTTIYCLYKSFVTKLAYCVLLSISVTCKQSWYCNNMQICLNWWTVEYKVT